MSLMMTALGLKDIPHKTDRAARILTVMVTQISMNHGVIPMVQMSSLMTILSGVIVTLTVTVMNSPEMMETVAQILLETHGEMESWDAQILMAMVTLTTMMPSQMSLLNGLIPMVMVMVII